MVRRALGERPLDIIKLIVSLILLALLTALTLQPVPEVVVIAPPTFTRPTSGTTIRADELLALEGTADPGATVRLFDGNVLLGEARADADGRWRFELPAPLAVGPHNLRAVVVDEEGRELASSQPLALTVIPPPAPPGPPVITSPASGSRFSVGEPLTFEGTTAPRTTVRLYDGDTPLGKATADAAGRWSFKFPELLAEGTHTLRAVVLDAAGNEIAASAPLVITIISPEVPPVVAAVVPAITFPTRGARLGAGLPLTLKGTAGPGMKVHIYDGDTLLGEAMTEADGRWRLELPTPLAEGAHNLRVAVRDAMGNEIAASEPLAFRIITAIMEPTILLPETGAVPLGGTLEGTADPLARLLIYDNERLKGEAAADPDGRWLFPLPASMSTGKHTLRVVAVDDLGRPLAESEPTVVQVLQLGLPTMDDC